MNSYKSAIKAAIIAHLDRLVALTVGRFGQVNWQLMPDLGDRIAFCVTDMPKITIFVCNMVKDRHAWVEFTKKLSSEWGVYVVFQSDNVMNLPSRIGKDNCYVVVGTVSELEAGKVAENESLYLLIVNSEAKDMDQFAEVKKSLRCLIAERLK